MRIHKISRLHLGHVAGLILLAFISACGSFPPDLMPVAPIITDLPPAATDALPPTNMPTPSPVPSATAPSTPELTATPTESIPPAATSLDPVEWMTWPVVPAVNDHVREIYALGQSLGNDPHAFSIFGDCQSEPDIFLGPFITDPAKFISLPANLQETVNYFEGSLNRESPTIKQGTTSGALFWVEWHENKYGCKDDESPLNCELRLQNPSFVLITVGTHFEGGRNEYYMRKVLDALLARGIVPILSTKADNREGDNHVNLETAKLAAEYNLPLWNFWPVTADLPNRGLYTKKIDRHLGDIYLTEEALELHRYSALQVLDAIWRAATGN
jgi:hypothetical protein